MTFGRVLIPFRLAMLLAGLVLATLSFTTLPARADLRVCNQSANQVSVALGYRADKGWQSEGWWVAPPKQCAVVYQGDLHSRFFYLYVADDIGGGAWDGSVYMCTRDESFTIFGVEDCLARGYERTGFFEVDTQNRTEWTLQLTDGGNSDTTASGEQGTDAAATGGAGDATEGGFESGEGTESGLDAGLD